MTDRPISTLARPQLAARIATLRSVLDILWDVTALTGGDPFLTIGRAKVELIQLEAQLRDLDRQDQNGEVFNPEKARCQENRAAPINYSPALPTRTLAA